MFGFDKAKQLAITLLTGDSQEPQDVIMADDEARKAVEEDFERAIIAELKKRYMERKSRKVGMDLQNRQNIDFYNGEQYVRIDYAKQDIEEVLPLSEWEERNVFNEIAPCVETRLAFLSKRKNNLKNRPASASSEDRTAAKIGNKVLASMKSKLNMSELQQEANLIAQVMGTAIWKTTWDSSAGRVIGFIQRPKTEDEKNLNRYGEISDQFMGYKPNTVTEKVHEGDISLSIHSPFEIFPENPDISVRRQRRIMQVVLMSPDEIFAKWGKIVKGEDHQTYKIVSSNDRNYGSGILGRTTGTMFAHSIVHDCVEVMEEWELPSPEYPDGRLMIGCEQCLFYYGKLPDAMGEEGEYILPFDVQQSIKTDGFFGESVVKRMIPIQIKYNSVKNRIQDYINRVTIGVLSVEENSLVDEDYYLDNGIAPGEVMVRRRGSDRPYFLSVDSLPDDVIREENDLLSMFNRLSGVSDITKQSTVPSQVTSGVAIAGLVEQDDTRIGLEAENIKRCLINVGRKVLHLYHDNVDYPRQVEDIGKNNEFDVIQFKGSDLRCFDVFIESEPESADTLAQRRQKVIELLNGGLFNDPETGNISKEGRIKVFEMLELGDWENFVEADDDQKKRAQRENNAMMTGDNAVLRDFDDDMTHISVHNNYRLKAEYEDAIGKDPSIEDRFNAHVNEHLQALQIKQQANQTMEQSDPYIQRSKVNATTFAN